MATTKTPVSGLLNVPAPEELTFFYQENLDYYKNLTQGQRYDVVLTTQRRIEGLSREAEKVSVNDMSMGTLSGHMERTIEAMIAP